MKITPFIALAGEKEKKGRKERKFTKCSHIMEYHCNFL
jgi:hypothetical protein